MIVRPRLLRHDAAEHRGDLSTGRALSVAVAQPLPEGSGPGGQPLFRPRPRCAEFDFDDGLARIGRASSSAISSDMPASQPSRFMPPSPVGASPSW